MKITKNFTQVEAPLTLIDPVSQATPDVAESLPRGFLPGSTLDWPDIDTIPAELMDLPQVPWQQAD